MIFDLKILINKYNLPRKAISQILNCSYPNLMHKMKTKKISLKEYDIIDNFIENYKNQK